MRKKPKKTHKHKKDSILPIFIIVISIIVLLGFFSRAFSKPLLRIASNDARDNLQLGTFYPTPSVPTPTKASPIATATPKPVIIPPTNTPYIPPPDPVPLCINHDTGHKVQDPTCRCSAWLIECKSGQCVQVNNSLSFNGRGSATCASFPTFCLPPVANDGDGWYCLGKPVIYLYPTKPTFVSVSVTTPGKIVVSDPLYTTGGWKNVWAESSGKLTYEGKNYRELFYESSISDFKKPTNGINIDSKNIRSELDELISKLGLINGEKTEFLDWWVPRLQALNSPYIEFSVIEKSAKDEIDHVDISPKPDTMIEFIAYFKPLSTPYQGDALSLPDTPKRIGFTAVEWGGVIDSN